MKRRATASKVVVFLLLIAGGAMVNVAVAWSLAIWGPPVAVAVRTQSGWRNDIVVWWKETAPAEFGAMPLQMNWVDTRAYESISASGKRSRFEALSLEIARRRYGWPTRSLECTCWTERPTVSATHSKIQGVLLQMSDQSVRALPTVMLPKRFAINTTFYATILWLVLAAPFALRRRRRIKRGLCAKCGYDLRGSAAVVCPECGAAAPIASRTPITPAVSDHS